MSAPIKNLIQHFEENTEGNDFIVGDIHGCFTRLQKLLDTIGFKPYQDRLFATGDLLDRGPECHLAADWLNKPWFHSVRGNHEDMPLLNKTLAQIDPRLTWIDERNGMGWWCTTPWETREAILKAIAELPIAIDIKTSHGLVGIVHSQVSAHKFGERFDLEYDWEEFLRDLSMYREERAEEVMWSRSFYESTVPVDIKNIWMVVGGHTPLNKPMKRGNMIFLDTGAVFEDYASEGLGKFSIFDISNKSIIQG